MSTYGQDNVKIFPQKLWWRWNHEYLGQRIFPVYGIFISSETLFTFMFTL